MRRSMPTCAIVQNHNQSLASKAWFPAESSYATSRKACFGARPSAISVTTE